MVFLAVLIPVLHFLAVAVVHTADPNIIVPALIAAIPVTLTAIGGLIYVISRVRKENKTTRENTDRVGGDLMEILTGVQSDIQTNHGKRPGEYLEMIGPLAEWATTHAHESNAVRAQLGLAPGVVPKFEESHAPE